MAIVNIINPPDGLNLRYYSIISHGAQSASYLWQSPQCRENSAATEKLICDGPKPTNANTLLCHLLTLWSSTHDILEKELCLREAVTGTLMEARVAWHSGIKNSLGGLQRI
ncbi:hypothetical protein O181_031798 [Austropuccinia psidii MF-1]|uniref:Uncharacterized protein n=1 Tax=Austropuccinia psidii MF-1 TaxID=1389203 RepID=A0A9Q3H4Z0_9BASI|nr:hypothetical protein [Austropuccinia psidii MF-1]